MGPLGVLDGSSSLGQTSLGQTTQPVFKSAIDVVSITAVVRDRKGRIVRDLTREDFLLFDSGRPRQIVDVNADATAPIRLALLLDVSGSMQVSSNLEEARQAGTQVLSWMDSTKDETALFSFDTRLKEMQPFTTDVGKVQRALYQTQPFGKTSLYDAIAETAERVADRATRRSAVLVLTDGIDTGSRRTVAEVSGLASSIDVPVYLIVVVSPLDHPGTEKAVEDSGVVPLGNLGDLARWTGGELFVVSSPAHASMAARALLADLRHQYLIAFESAAEPGWHPLEVRTRKENLLVRARSGYFAGRLPTVG
jgi:Ca-activated chloride channel family protein